MAYKFQRGTAKLSGSITLEENLQVDGTIQLADGSLSVDELNIDGATDIGADLADADLLIVDDGAGGTNRKSALSRMKKYIYSAVSGDATVSDAGALTIANDAVESGMLNDNVISGQSALGGASIAQGDEFLFSDDGTVKKVTFSNLEDSIFANVSGDATIAAGGDISLGIGAITNQTAMTGDVADADEFMINDGGALKRVDFSVVRDAVFADVSGDATVAAGGAITIAANAVEGSMLNSNVAGPAISYASSKLTVNANPDSFSVSDGDGLALSSSVAGAGLALAGGALSVDIDELSALGGASLHQTQDHFMFSDNGTEKKISFSNLEDSIFANVSGDATIAAGGALTIAAAAVHHGMLNDDIISGQDELAHADIADADELMISDAGTIKRVGVDSLRDHFFGVVSGDATIADGGALTIANSAVQDAMLHDDVATGLAGDGLSAASGVMAVAVSGALAIASDKLGIPSSAIGAGLATTGPAAHVKTIALNANPDSFSVSDGDGLALSSSVAGAGLALAAGVLSVDIDELSALGGTGLHQTQDHFMFSDNGTEKKITFSNLEDAIFANISGDATIAAGGALTIANDAVQAAMMNDDCISGFDDIGADIAATDELLISDGGTLKRTDVSRIGTFLAGAGLTASSGVLAAKCDNSSIEVADSGDNLRVKALGVTNAMLAGSIANAKLANSTVSFGGVSLALGASDGTPAFNLSDASAYVGDSALVTVGNLDSGAITSNFGAINNGASNITTTGTGSFGTMVISGDLTVSGNTTTINTTAVAIADHNIVLDRDNSTSAVINGAGFTIEGGSGDDLTFQWLAASNRMELKLGSAYADFKMGVLSAVDGAFSGDVSCLGVKETVQAITGAKTVDFADGMIVKCSAASAPYTITLPAASGNSGRMLKVKRVDNATHVITIDANSSETIDGFATIALESDFAGLSLLCDGSNWFIL